jgi:DNA mismatch repair protein MutS
VRRLRRYRADDHLSLDPATKRNLELVAPMHGGGGPGAPGRDGSLVAVLDQTLTPMGGRLLRQWLVRPLRDVGRITGRLDAVDAFHGDARLRRALRDDLKRVGDVERLIGKVATSRATPRDLVALGRALAHVPGIKATLAGSAVRFLSRLDGRLDPCAAVAETIASTLVDEPPASVAQGGAVREGVSDELDRLRTVSGDAKAFLARLQADEAKKTGITSLKVGYNRVFGYYLEVSNTHKDKAPAAWIRKQTLTGAERYITPELKEYEETILTAHDRALEIEAQIVEGVRAETAACAEAIQTTARALATLDTVAALAETAERHGYVRPTVDDSGVLEIDAGRHPVVEQALPAGEAFIPNSLRIAAGDTEAAESVGQIHLVTGPNMAGKSVVLRQTGLIVLLAQVGSFVPAARARVGVVDALFTRVGASDNLAAGESTFLVEMNETAAILHNATARSLVLLDEVGRGTSTFDGLSLAWAIVEHLHETPAVAARTLFATHYHELNALADRLPRVRPFRVQVQEHDGRVIFLRTVVPGGADHSYGIEVARMAGLPASVVARAKSVLAHLEAHDVASEVGVAGGDGMPAAARGTVAGLSAPGAAPSPPPDPVATDVLARVRALDPDRMTPIEALMALSDLKRTAE